MKSEKEIVIASIWHLNTVSIPVIIGTLGMIKMYTDTHIKKISENPSLSEMGGKDCIHEHLQHTQKNSPNRICSIIF